MPTNNAINLNSAGITGYNGTGTFSGSAAAQYTVQVGGATTSTLVSVGPGTAGQVLQSGGGAANPAFSTATYPATATGTGKILRADGTNWVVTTATYPDTAGTSGNILTSDGTNFVSTAPGTTLVQFATLTLTSLQIKSLHGTPVQMIPAPGVGKVICTISPMWSNFIYGGSNVFVAGAGQSISLFYGTGTQASNAANVGNTVITGTTSVITTQVTAVLTGTAIASLENLALNAYVQSATEISGNAANNNTVTLTCAYYIATL